MPDASWWDALNLELGVVYGVGLSAVLSVLLQLALSVFGGMDEVGTVYVTIPAGQKAGGQVELLLQGRLTMADALFRGTEPLRPGTKVTIVEKIGHSTLIVEPLS